MHEQDNDTNSLAHTKRNCKYHIVFAPKYRRKVFYNEKREDVREILRTLCKWKGADIIEGEICPFKCLPMISNFYFFSPYEFLLSLFHFYTSRYILE